jgi:hypothetical protein
MDPSAVLILTWVLAGAVVGLYIWFVVWRFRVDRRKKAADAQEQDTLTRALDRLAASPPPPETQVTATPETPSAPAPAPPSTEPAPTVPAAPAAPPPVEVAAAPSSPTVATVLSGIQLPNGLVPLTTMAPRTGTGDRVAFWTDEAPVEVVGPAFADELERLGFTIIPLDERSMSAQRDSTRLVVVIHPDGRTAKIADAPAFTSVPERSVVIETWLPE